MDIRLNSSFSWEWSEKEECPFIYLHGKILLMSDAEQLWEEASERIKTSPWLVIDLWDLEMMSSEGLNVLLRLLTLCRNRGGDIFLTGMNAKLRELFLITRIDSIFSIAEDSAHAMNMCRTAMKSNNE
jgi:anti-sigma B factor antagonist